METELLLSTFSSLLRVTLHTRWGLRRVETVDCGRGIYFGLTRGNSRIFAVARNLDIHKRVQARGAPTNSILVFSEPLRGLPPRVVQNPGVRDLHQIRFRDELIWLVSGRSPELLAIDPNTGRSVGHIFLSRFLPLSLRHEAPAQHPEDPYHFNSLHFGDFRLFVLAHNWWYGSFVMEFEYHTPEKFLRAPRLLRIWPVMGQQSHDLFHDGTRLLTLDSGGSRLISSDGIERPVGHGMSGQDFLRGMAVGERFLFVGHGRQSRYDREDRADGPTRISVVHRTSMEVVSVVEVGSFGNTCDLLLLSEPDQSDSGCFKYSSIPGMVAAGSSGRNLDGPNGTRQCTGACANPLQSPSPTS